MRKRKQSKLPFIRVFVANFVEKWQSEMKI